MTEIKEDHANRLKTGKLKENGKREVNHINHKFQDDGQLTILTETSVKNAINDAFNEYEAPPMEEAGPTEQQAVVVETFDEQAWDSCFSKKVWDEAEQKDEFRAMPPGEKGQGTIVKQRCGGCWIPVTLTEFIFCGIVTGIFVYSWYYLWAQMIRGPIGQKLVSGEEAKIWDCINTDICTYSLIPMWIAEWLINWISTSYYYAYTKVSKVKKEMFFPTKADAAASGFVDTFASASGQTVSAN
jgi:hypothetical protein